MTREGLNLTRAPTLPDGETRLSGKRLRPLGKGRAENNVSRQLGSLLSGQSPRTFGSGGRTRLVRSGR